MLFYQGINLLNKKNQSCQNQFPGKEFQQQEEGVSQGVGEEIEVVNQEVVNQEVVNQEVLWEESLFQGAVVAEEVLLLQFLKIVRLKRH